MSNITEQQVRIARQLLAKHDIDLIWDDKIFNVQFSTSDRVPQKVGFTLSRERVDLAWFSCVFLANVIIASLIEQVLDQKLLDALKTVNKLK